ncbi:GNAT family N-acetyltransferase, partial [Candidatus Neomarinimicrobiota bacterium]
FNLDPQFKNNEFEKLYKLWIKKSVSPEITKDVLIFTEDKTEQGFITIEIMDHRGVIGLIAVEQKMRGKSIGTKLVKSALVKLKNWGIGEVNVTSQEANKIACALFKTCGFKINNIINTYHIWI